MKKSALLLIPVLLFTASCDQSHLQQAHVSMTPSIIQTDRVLLACVEPGKKAEEFVPSSAPAAPEEKPDAVLEGRKRMVPAIYAAFAKRTTPERAKWLAEVCYQTTEGTRFTPLDLAEIALAETGAHKLSSRAVSAKGALGVWQMMPERARSHGFHPAEMRNDQKCAEAAVRELNSKLVMAKGNLSRAKRLYCGAGPAARAYDKVRKKFRAEILDELKKGWQMQLQPASNKA